MVAQHPELMTLVRAIVADDTATATRLLAESPLLAMTQAPEGATRHEDEGNYFLEIEHYLLRGRHRVAHGGRRVPGRHPSITHRCGG